MKVFPVGLFGSSPNRPNPKTSISTPDPWREVADLVTGPFRASLGQVDTEGVVDLPLLAAFVQLESIEQSADVALGSGAVGLHAACHSEGGEGSIGVAIGQTEAADAHAHGIAGFGRDETRFPAQDDGLIFFHIGEGGDPLVRPAGGDVVIARGGVIPASAVFAFRRFTAPAALAPVEGQPVLASFLEAAIAQGGPVGTKFVPMHNVSWRRGRQRSR